MPEHRIGWLRGAGEASPSLVRVVVVPPDPLAPLREAAAEALARLDGLGARSPGGARRPPGGA